MILPDLLSPEERAARFARICADAMNERRRQGEGGVGTLAEKWQHQIIKRYLTENPTEQEVRISTARKFVADVCVGDRVYEVQTADFAPMAKKIAYCLEETDLSVTVVHPIAKNRWVSYIDPETAEITPRRRSPRHGKDLELLPRLYPLIPLLQNPRLSFRILLLEVHDFRLREGNSRRKPRFERIPLSLIEDRSLESPRALAALVPDKLPSPFTVKEFSKATGLKGRDAYSAVRVLAAIGAVSPTDPIGRSMAFLRNESSVSPVLK